jgi:high-affinity nickel-transport protein
VLVACAIGTVELLQVLSTELNLNGLFWNWLNALNFEMIGFGIVGIFIVSWLVSFGVWQYKKFDKFNSFSQIQETSSIKDNDDRFCL